MLSSSDIVIIGAGIAGYSVAAELVSGGCQDKISIIGDESEAPYDRPPLSKDFLANGDETSIRLTPLPKDRVQLWLGDPVIEIDTVRRTLLTQSGRSQGWGQLVFATGAVPHNIPNSTLDRERVHVLRTLNDARNIRAAIARAERVVLVGGGPIGLELAAFARSEERRVTVIDAADRLMARCAPPLLSDRLQRFHAERGVDVRLRASVRAIRSDGSVELGDGTALGADVIVVGIGVRANDNLAHRSGIDTQDGILVDEWFRTNIPNVFAVGDVVRVRNSFTGRYERNETWWSARDQGVALARALLEPASAPAFQATNWFWSDQDRLFIQGAGVTEGPMQTIRGDATAESFSVLQWDSSCLVGVASVNAQRDFQILKRLIASRAKLDPEEISKPTFNLKQLAAGLNSSLQRQ